MGGGTSLSVTAWKAAERVVASSFVFQGKYDPYPFSLLLSHADLASSRGGCWRTSLSVNGWKAAGRVVARLFGEGSTSMSLNMDFCDCAN